MLAAINFVSDQDDRHLDLGLVQVVVGYDAVDEVVLPLLDALVAVPIRQVKHDDAAVCASVETVTQALESLLAGSIPDLQRDSFA